MVTLNFELNINKEALGTITKGDSAGTEGFNEDSKKILTQIYDFIDKKVAGGRPAQIRLVM